MVLFKLSISTPFGWGFPLRDIFSKMQNFDIYIILFLFYFFCPDPDESSASESESSEESEEFSDEQECEVSDVCRQV